MWVLLCLSGQLASCTLEIVNSVCKVFVEVKWGYQPNVLEFAISFFLISDKLIEWFIKFICFNMIIHQLLVLCPDRVVIFQGVMVCFFCFCCLPNMICSSIFYCSILLQRLVRNNISFCRIDVIWYLQHRFFHNRCRFCFFLSICYYTSSILRRTSGFQNRFL